MLFALICKDKPGKLQLRVDTRPAHAAFLQGLISEGKLAFAGPFRDADGKPDGSLVMIEAVDMTAAQVLAASDPYAKAGLFESVEIRPWNWVFQKPAGA
ncbi:MAG: hypothetical protein EOS65_20275 [Mesorhizobium sp.]|uniref:YciI-like protein n=1 Tax=Mesorhizobium sp. TaxID=1871066 RepID=UPI000FD5DBAF|nr:YciI-like protein [Mesorhizobium sp.]RVC56455.1 hypothetical protein EN779_24440 [Mesorhizobium sp. M4B.F.Ca.ET.088.02.2.1]RWF26049.1 MAG: hypothetical protein EOS45_29545 [Mesorhizobium sp.]RWF39193.1 MAG: hypothetical protein EOS65_20275 [Mesorhizobium sp.]TIX09902.1 MAG: hypothetical protein E5V41_30455 [Mesorhizobium sp.]TIX38387.1 MAG: hypothetical protein E5V40_19575 [Mesorhizobium sp.]